MRAGMDAGQGTTFLEILVNGAAAEGLGVIRASVFQAVDRPDRLELTVAQDREAPWLADPRGLLEEPTSIATRIQGRVVFHGRPDRVSLGLDAIAGPTVTVVAHSRYHHLRRGGRRVYYQLTDGEIAERIAWSLDLAPVVDPMTRVQAQVAVEGDPLAFLRGRARASGRHLAVTHGKLYFLQHLPSGGALTVVHPLRDVFRIEVSEREGKGRGGRLEAPGSPAWKPLGRLRIQDAGLEPRGAIAVHAPGGLLPRTVQRACPSSSPGGREDCIIRGDYTIVRALHRIDGRGHRTEVEFLEEGLDEPLWRTGRICYHASHAI